MFYGAGASANAAKIAGYFGVTATALDVAARRARGDPARHRVHRSCPACLAPAATPAATPSAGPTSAGNNGAAGSAVTVTANAKYGIPCVY